MESKKCLKKIFNGKNLSVEESKIIFKSILSGNVRSEEIAAFLIGLKVKGETSDEIAGAILALESMKTTLDNDGINPVDTCGTGGDGKNCINVSTICSIVVASDGIPVAKHGNSAQSGKIGSADILEKLGIPVKLKKEEAEKYLMANKYVFLFAPFYHPGMKYVGSIRQLLGVPTVFNYLGPFLNPAKLKFQIVGINGTDKLKLLAEAIMKIGRDNILLYSSNDGYDEFSTNAATKCFEVNGGIKESCVIPEKFFKPFPMPAIKNENDAKKLFINALKGNSDKLTKLIALNTAYIFKKMKNFATLKESFEYGYEHIKSGKPFEKFIELSEGEYYDNL